MKKKILSLLAAILCAIFCFAGCNLGSYIENGNNNNPTNPSATNPSKPDDPDNPDNPDLSTHYIVEVYYNNALYNPGKDRVYVILRNDYEVHKIELGANGTVDAGELDGDFVVYLEGLPKKYAYNPNGYKASSNSRLVSILLTDYMLPTNVKLDAKGEETGADGRSEYVDFGCYRVEYDGTYRAKLEYEGDRKYYEYHPTAAGIYSIVSCVNIYDDKFNPQIEVYNGTFANKWYAKTIDGGGASLSGGVTINFRHEVRISAGEVGGSFSFAIIAVDNNSGEYPIFVDFAITYEGAYKSGDEDIREVRSEEKQLIKAAPPKLGEKFIYADLGKKEFRNANYKYNEETGRYHVYSMKLYGDDSLGYGAGFGPSLLCAITPKVPAYSTAALFDADKIPNPATGGVSNYLRLYNCWLEDEQKYVTYDYTNFIKEDYYGVCNAQGYCYVTKELKEFLHDFADKNSLWSDQTMLEFLTGTPEILGYKANEDSLWLWACGFYAKDTPDL